MRAALPVVDLCAEDGCTAPLHDKKSDRKEIVVQDLRQQSLRDVFDGTPIIDVCFSVHMFATQPDNKSTVINMKEHNISKCPAC